jgi:hypothetical protein
METHVSLLRRTTYRCGKLEKTIISYLLKKYPSGVTVEEILDFIEKHGPTNGELIHMTWKGVRNAVYKYGPRKGRTLEYALDALKRLEKRNIIKIGS